MDDGVLSVSVPLPVLIRPADPVVAAETVRSLPAVTRLGTRPFTWAGAVPKIRAARSPEAAPRLVPRTKTVPTFPTLRTVAFSVVLWLLPAGVERVRTPPNGEVATPVARAPT